MHSVPPSQAIHFNPFVPPPSESLIGIKSIVFWGHNILTLGIYAAATTLAKQHYVRQLKIVREDLQREVDDVGTSWNELEKSLTTLLDDVRASSDADAEHTTRWRGRLDKLSLKKDRLQEEGIRTNLELAATISEIALGTIAFVGQLILNILTIGLYGVLQNNDLRNRISNLEAQNTYIQDQFETRRKEKFENLDKIVDSIRDFIAAKEENASVRDQIDGIKHTDPAKAFFEIQQAKQDVASLQKKHNAIQLELTAAKADLLKAEKDKKAVDQELVLQKHDNSALQKRVAKLQDDEKAVAKEIAKLKQEAASKDQALKSQQQKAKIDIDALAGQLTAAKQKADKVTHLESQITKLQAAQAHHGEIVKLSSQIGPLPPKYIPQKGDGELPGAMDIDDMGDEFDPQEVAFAQGYNKRYGDKRSAADVAVASFEHSCDELFDMAKKGSKIKLNNSDETNMTLGMFAVYRQMALDLIKGGKVVSNGCHGFKLKINSDVEMLPSRPEQMLQFKPDVAVGLKPVVQLHYRQRDDFTPDEETLRLKDGVDAVSVKWILEQLSDEEMNHLHTHLMESVIENTHPDFIKMRAFMQKKNDRAQLVLTASEMIQNLATALHMKYNSTTLIPPYQNKFDGDVKPFVKKEDDQTGLDKLQDDCAIKQGTKVINWEIDADVLGDKRAFDIKPRQQDFCDLMTAYRQKLQSLQSHMGPALLEGPEKPGTTYQEIDWNNVNKQYYVSHQMIGCDFNGDGGERCLFSNLLAILVTDKKHLTGANVQKLKNVMANYLDKLIRANGTWAVEKSKPLHLQTKDIGKIKELAELYKAFEQGIRKTHNCSITQYQGWLRNDPFTKAPINLSNLTPFEIQVAAYALGIRIGILPIKVKMATTVDEAGRLISEAMMFGPNTKELLMMGVWDPLDGKGGSYYGLFPKLNINDNRKLQADPKALDAAFDVDSYWKSIRVSKT